MDLLSLNEFTIEDIQSLIDNEVEENVHLDYKYIILNLPYTI